MVKQIAFDLVKKGKSPGLVYNLVLSHFQGDAEVETFLLDKLKTDPDKNSAIQALGKIRSARALDEIKNLLDSNEAGKSFHKVRAYLAMGDIGGDKAFDYLMEYFKKEKPSLDKDDILFAIGRTKTSRAKVFLIDRLQNTSG